MSPTPTTGHGAAAAAAPRNAQSACFVYRWCRVRPWIWTNEQPQSQTCGRTDVWIVGSATPVRSLTLTGRSVTPRIVATSFPMRAGLSMSDAPIPRLQTRSIGHAQFSS